VPALESEWYKVHGMGYANIDVTRKSALFYGDSHDYNLFFSAAHLDLVKQFQPEWNFNLKD